MMKFEIKHRYSNAVLFSIEIGSLKLAVEAAIKADADLGGADLRGKIRAYKLVDADGQSPIHHQRLAYEIGGSLEVEDANCDPEQDCGAGINLATLPWCRRWYSSGYRILIAEFEAKDIACIPHGTDGKFRVHRCTIVGEKDLREIGFVQEATDASPVPAKS